MCCIPQPIEPLKCRRYEVLVQFDSSLVQKILAVLILPDLLAYIYRAVATNRLPSVPHGP